MTNLTLDLTHENFGIHEHFDYPPIVQDIFQGRVQIKDGYAWINEKPGWGIEVDEALAAKHPINDEHPERVSHARWHGDRGDGLMEFPIMLRRTLLAAVCAVTIASGAAAAPAPKVTSLPSENDARQLADAVMALVVATK